MKHCDHSPFRCLDNEVPFGRICRHYPHNIGVVGPCIQQIIRKVISETRINEGCGWSLRYDLWRKNSFLIDWVCGRL